MHIPRLDCETHELSLSKEEILEITKSILETVSWLHFIEDYIVLETDPIILQNDVLNFISICVKEGVELGSTINEGGLTNELSNEED